MINNENRSKQATELRQVAEESLQGISVQSLKDLEALLPKKSQGLLHELRVHQIELEMQNDALRRAQTELAAERQRYVDLYELAPVGYCTVSEEGLILEANLNASTLLGVTRGALSNQPLPRFILNKDQDLYYLLNKRLFESGEPQAQELRMVKADGTIFWAHLKATTAFDASGTQVSLIVLSDITERKQAVEALGASEKRLSDIIKFLPTATLAINKEGRVIIWNKAIEEMTGITAAEMLGQGDYAYAIPFYGVARPFLLNLLIAKNNETAALYPHVINDGDSVQTEAFCNALYANKGGWVFTKASPLHDQDGNIIGAIESIRDISERKMAETYGNLSREVLHILNEPCDLQNSIERVLAVLKTRTGFDAVGIRLQEGEDYPYFVQEGFPSDFLLTENTLMARTPENKICRDQDGKVKLECTCGLVLSGRTDQTNPLFTPGGSCWTNDSTLLLDIPSSDDPRLNPRNQCVHHNFASVALIPIRDKERIIGLIQFNDRHKDSFTLRIVELLESIATNLGAALVRKQAEEELRERAQDFRTLADSGQALIWTAGTDKSCNYFNKVWLEFTGRTLEQETGNGWLEGVHPEDMQTCLDVYVGAFDRREKFSMMYRLRRYDGAYRWLLDDGCPRYDSNGAFIGYIGHCLDITERKRSEEALRESEERFRLLHNASFGGIVIHDQGVILDCNQGLSDLTGYSREELIGMDGLNLIAPDWRELVRQNIRHRFEQPYDAEGCRKDGTLFPVYIRGTTIPYKGRRVRVTEFRDITDRKQAEAALLESEATVRKKLQIILDPEGDIGTLELADIINAPALQTMIEQFHRITNIGGGVAILDIRGKVLVAVGWQDICTKFHRVHPVASMNCKESDTVLSGDISAGMSKAYRCKNNLWDIATPIIIGDRHLGNVFVGQFFYEDEVIDYELFRRQAQQYGFNEKEYLAALDRIPRWSRESVEAAMSFYGSLAMMISTLSYSTIKLSRALSQKDSALHQLDESKAFQASLLETIPIPVFYKDTEGNFLGFNRAFEDFYGKTKEHLIGKTVFDLYPHDLAKIYYDQDAKLIKQQSLQVYESKYQNSHGIIHDIIFHKATLVDTHGVIIGLIGAIIDITERKRAEEESKSLQAQLIQAQKMEAIGTLAGGIAHDFNNILGAILGYSEIAKDTLPEESEAVKHLEKILTAGLRATDLVKQILAFSRQTDAKYIPVKPQLIVPEAIKLLRPSLPATIAIRQNIAVDTPSILADPTQVHQILMNLCTNAYHAMEQDGGTLSVTLMGCELSREDLELQPDVQPGPFVMLSIGDTGQGIASEIRNKIFDPYFTTKEVGKGTGLGLAIIHGIVTSYGGFVTCESEPGKGTVFNVYFPALNMEVTAEVKVVETAPLGTERILLIDDEEMLADLGKAMLERLGYEITALTSSLDALALFQDQPDRFDAVITDHTMPGMTGKDLARRLLQIRPEIPIILCTGDNRLLSERQVEVEGIRGLVIKPFAKTEIATLLRKVLENNCK